MAARMSKRRWSNQNRVEAQMIEYLARRLEPSLARVARWERTKVETTLERQERG